MLPIFWPSIPTSLPTPTFDPSLAISKGTRTERVRMMAWAGTHSTLNHHTSHSLLPTPCNPNTLLTNLTLLNNFYHPPLALVSTLTPTPWQMAFNPPLPTWLPLLLPLPTQPQTRKSPNRKAIRMTRKARHRLRQRQGPLTPTSLVPLGLALLNCTFIATSMAG
jgi:hypothetical protein